MSHENRERKGRGKLQKKFSVSQGTKSCELVYEFLRSDDETVSKTSFIDKLDRRGILQDDPRLADIMENLEHTESYMSKDTFMRLIAQDWAVIERAFTNSYIIYNFEKFANQIRQMYYECSSNNEGTKCDYIPQLARQKAQHFAVSVCTVDGQRINVGHSDVDFCVKSCTKPVSYCMALEELGMDVHKHVGREPSGTRFNALKVMDSGLPHNPLVESGAIMICSLIQQGSQPADRFDHVTNTWADLAGGFPMGFSNSAYLAERRNSDRDYALAHFMKENGAFPDDVDIIDVLEFYFQCCALNTNTNHLSIVAASLANGGVCPLTGKQIFSSDTVKNCLSMMYSCGMYDYSGEFAFTAGLPASSGEAGVIMVVIPNVLGVVTFSPLLDKFGNSTRGVEFFSKFTQKFNFHMFDNIEIHEEAKEDPRSSNAQEEVTVEKIIRYSSLGDLSALKRLRPSLEELSNGDYDRRTPLHLSASNGHLDVVEYILELLGFEHVNPVDRWAGTPYDDALRENNQEVANYLRSVGGKPGTELAVS